ncbi:Helix-turn-helix domain-containing protein [Flavobacterium segetis]|uniref:Helix-turn-helix domain-containing protein n=1 Tax=Flavobacterium segetis TaxID=271157 RepID=A0A1M5JZH0_9FLAO|nr:helix-turn-helix transcriptional regulator [Flavobacterium segetis]SHG45785.1 Helix-turn-helix domain-containing protein [Flavobacterium segetis]
MDIGTAIKILRKEKQLGQKQLAEMCGISVNALSQIEINATFPQKNTIKKICESLQIPVSYLLFFSISDDDIPDDKKVVFKSLNSAIKSILIE